MQIRRVIGSFFLVRALREYLFRKKMKRRGKCLQLHGYECITKIDEIGNSLGIKLWIEWGTLLGFVREGALIGHDYDLDFATLILSSDLYNSFYKSLCANGFVLIRQFKYNDIIISETYSYKNVHVDIDYCLHENGKIVNYEYDVKNDTKIKKDKTGYHYENLGAYIYTFNDFSLVRGKFKNQIECYIPDDAEEHICYAYGQNWKTPDKNSDWKSLNNYEYSEDDNKLTGWMKE